MRNKYCSLFVLLLFLMLCGLSETAAQASVQGEWTTLSTQMPINPIHVALMHDGRVLVVAGSAYAGTTDHSNFRAGVWDPSTDAVTTQPISWDMFCNGMIVLPDGRPFIAGGNLQYDPFKGLPNVSVFDPLSNSFSDLDSMHYARWYPTATLLPEGRVLLFSGLDANGATTPTLEIYTPGSGWTQGFGAGWTPPLYPRMHVLPNGKLFYSGPSITSRFFDPGVLTWTTVANTNYANSRTYGSSVLLPLTIANSYAAKVLIMGGGRPSTATTEIIDLSQPKPAWHWGPNMSQPRIQMNAVILPDGKALAVGGSLYDEDASSASLNADLYDPVTNSFASAGSNAFPRLYHSVALLLPDATVWVAGGNPVRGSYRMEMEIYKPPYLFRNDKFGQPELADRPVTGNVSPRVPYGESFTVETPNADNIGSVVFVRPGAVTHAFDMEQRLIELRFSADPSNGLLSVTAPANSNLAPPGYYMLFLLDKSGVPSVAKFVQLYSQASADFSIATSVTSRTIVQGNSTTYPVVLTPLSGFVDNVSFNVSGLPTGVSATFAPATLKASGRSTLNVSTQNTTLPGTYPLVITATGGGLTHTLTVKLIVSMRGNFTISASPTSQAVPRGSSKMFTITITPMNGFVGTVNLTWTGTTANITTTLNPVSISQSGSSTLTVNVGTLASLGNHSLSVKGTYGPVSKSVSMTVIVQ
jgi:Domain of unknown function (DUF1929)